MATESAEWEILSGEAIVTDLTVTLIAATSAGDPSAFRTMAHPDSANFPLVTYNRNPDRTINFDQSPLYPPSSRVLRTLDTTEVFVTQNDEDDVVITEIWTGNDRRSPMAASQFRRMYELAINPPEVSSPELFIQWSPADRTDVVYNVIILDLRVGGGSGKLDIKEWGSFAAGTLDAVATGLLDRTVEWDLKIVSQV